MSRSPFGDRMLGHIQVLLAGSCWFIEGVGRLSSLVIAGVLLKILLLWYIHAALQHILKVTKLILGNHCWAWNLYLTNNASFVHLRSCASVSPSTLAFPGSQLLQILYLWLILVNNRINALFNHFPSIIGRFLRFLWTYRPLACISQTLLIQLIRQWYSWIGGGGSSLPGIGFIILLMIVLWLLKWLF